MNDYTTNEIPYGYCHCGCGQKTKIADSNDKRYGWIKGQPRRFLRGHCARQHPTEKDFWMLVDRRESDACWLWHGDINDSGYGKFRYKSKYVYAHRLAYEFTNGIIPDGLIICHKCDNPACINPNHLFLGTYFDNSQDMIAKGRQRKALGSDSGRAKLTDAQVVEIRKRYAAGGIRQRELASEYDVAKDTIWYLINRKTWRHI